MLDVTSPWDPNKCLSKPYWKKINNVNINLHEICVYIDLQVIKYYLKFISYQNWCRNHVAIKILIYIFQLLQKKTNNCILENKSTYIFLNKNVSIFRLYLVV
jgi:hypothetical protein